MLRAFAGGCLFGDRYGTSPPRVLLLHGWQRTHGDFDLLAKSLDGAIALDLPGFGATPPPPEAWGSPQYAAALAPVLEEMEAPVVLVGHSFGGRVALALACAYPERIGALVLCGVPLYAPAGGRRPPLAYASLRTLARAHLVSRARLERARERYGSSDYRAARGVVRDVLVRVLHEDYEPMMKRIEVPVKLLWGALDTVVDPEVARRALSVLREADLELVEGCGHLVPSEAPEALAATVKGLL